MIMVVAMLAVCRRASWSALACCGFSDLPLGHGWRSFSAMLTPTLVSNAAASTMALAARSAPSAKSSAAWLIMSVGSAAGRTNSTRFRTSPVMNPDAGNLVWSSGVPE